MHALGSTLTRLLAVGLTLAAAALQTGCTISKDPLVLDVPPTAGALAVDVENFRGTVEIRADRRTETVNVETRVEGPESTVESVRVEAEVQEHGARAVLRVRAMTDEVDPEIHRAHLLITVPRVDGVRVVNRDGNVVVVNGTGAVEITNTNGAVDYRTEYAVIDPVTITTVDGNIFYQVPPGSTGLFDLQTLDGRVSFKNREGDTDGSVGGGPGVTTRLNNGTNPVIARTNDGDIYVRVAEDAVKTVGALRGGFADPRDSMHLQSSRRFTRNLPDDHPDIFVPTRQSARYLDEQ